MSLLRVEELSVEFRTRRGALRAVRDVTISLERGETVCLVGESGSGKSTLSMALVGLLPDNARVEGRVVFDGRQLLSCSEEQLSDIRGRQVGVIVQDPARSLNPVLTIGRQISEVMVRHLAMGKQAAWARAEELLAEVGVNDPGLRVTQYPHELSGGIKQRVMIAMAIACEPAILIADEPTTALDVTIQGQVLRLLRRLCAERQLALILVTHDFGVVAAMADRVAVMYAGRVVELAGVFELFRSPQHPYTKALLAANPRKVLDADSVAATLDPIPGSPPSPFDVGAGCSFSPRCGHRYEACESHPSLLQCGEGHFSACWLANHE